MSEHAIGLALPVAGGDGARRVGSSLTLNGSDVSVGAVDCRRERGVGSAHEGAHTVHRDVGGLEIEAPELHVSLSRCVVAPHPLDEVEDLLCVPRPEIQSGESGHGMIADPLSLRIRRVPFRIGLSAIRNAVDLERERVERRRARTCCRGRAFLPASMRIQSPGWWARCYSAIARKNSQWLVIRARV